MFILILGVRDPMTDKKDRIRNRRLYRNKTDVKDAKNHRVVSNF